MSYDPERICDPLSCDEHFGTAPSCGDLLQEASARVAEWNDAITREEMFAHVQSMATWLNCYEALEVVETVGCPGQCLASAIALTPQIRSALPLEESVLDSLGAQAGSALSYTLAEDEVAPTRYRAASLMSELEPQDRLECLATLVAAAAQVRKSLGPPPALELDSLEGAGEEP